MQQAHFRQKSQTYPHLFWDFFTERLGARAFPEAVSNGIKASTLLTLLGPIMRPVLSLIIGKGRAMKILPQNSLVKRIVIFVSPAG